MKHPVYVKCKDLRKQMFAKKNYKIATSKIIAVKFFINVSSDCINLRNGSLKQIDTFSFQPKSKCSRSQPKRPPVDTFESWMFYGQHPTITKTHYYRAESSKPRNISRPKINRLNLTKTLNLDENLGQVYKCVLKYAFYPIDRL